MSFSRPLPLINKNYHCNFINSVLTKSDCYVQYLVITQGFPNINIKFWCHLYIVSALVRVQTSLIMSVVSPSWLTASVGEKFKNSKPGLIGPKVFVAYCSLGSGKLWQAY